MTDRKDLRAGIEQMRSVAQLLSLWANDLEQSLTDPAPAPEPTPAPTPEPSPLPPTLKEVRALLTVKCAEGYGSQVRALIASFGATSLSGVPEASYQDLMDAAQLLGEGESPDAG